MTHGSYPLEHLLETFTTSQLRDLDLSLAPSVDAATRAKNHAELIRLIVKRHDGKKLALHALRLEALLPYKHVFIFSFSPPKDNFDIDVLRERVARGFPGLFDTPSLIDPHSEELEPEACVYDRARQRLFVKFVHLVETWKWERSSDTKKELKSYQRRHPVVVNLMPADKLMTVCFPGYTQGAAGPYSQRSTYSDIARSACSKLTEQTKIEVSGFQLRQTIELLLQKEPNRVEDIRRYLKNEDGRMMFDARYSTGGLVQYVAKTFLRETGIDVPESAWRSLFRAVENVDILLIWKKEEILTRIAFHDYAPELLFIWKSISAEASRIDDILKMIVKYHEYVSKSQLAEAVEFVDQTSPGTVIRPSAFGQKFDLTLDETLGVLYRARDRGIVETLFRVRTDDILVDFENNWRISLGEFPAEVRDEHGESIDLGENSNIEVAFRRRSA